MAEVGPAPRPLPCATCGKLVDALRAPRVRCIESHLIFFCSSEHAEVFDRSQPPPAPAPALPSADEVRGAPTAAAGTDEFSAPLPTGGQHTEAGGDNEAPPPPQVTSAEPLLAPEPEFLASLTSRNPSRADSQDVLLVGIAGVSGLFSLALLLISSSSAAQTARLVVLGAGSGVLIAHAILTGRDPRQLDRFSPLVGPLVATLTALVAYFSGHPATNTALTTAGALIATSALITALVQRTTRPIDQARVNLAESLKLSARRLTGHLTEYCAADELRPGEEVLVQAGELVPADGSVVAGQAQVVPWFGSVQVEPRVDGDPILSGAKVVDGALRVVTGWTGLDRAWLRLVADRRRRADLESASARTGYVAAQRGSMAAAGLVLLAGLALRTDGLILVSAAAAAHAAFAHGGIAELAAVRMAKACLEALSHGIAFHSAEHLDEAGRVTIGALCARGTVLLGEPEVTGIEPLDQLSHEELLALASGAESAVHHPVATAVLRAARARNVRPDATRNHNPIAGLGVTAVTSAGKNLVVGSRALMLREKISVARAEQRITELEAMGRTALLVAVDDRLAGVLALQDGLRGGARAAVQHLLDLGVEPVLLSGDSRETTDAIARSIDIEHVRPELPAAQRGDEVKQLSDGGAVVAVIGRSPVDDIALSAADVSITLRAAAATNADWSVGLASDDVRDAARALRIARRARDSARSILAVTILPPTVATLAVAFGLVSPAVAPVAALLGTLAGCFRSRED